MKIKYSALVSDMRGKLNGSVASVNKYASYLRNKVTPVNRKSSAQIAVRNFFTTVAQAWRGLTADQRAQWNAGAKNFSRTNIFGDLKQLSGFNLFMRLNQNLLNVSEAQITVCPLPTEVVPAVCVGAAMDVSNASCDLTLANAINAGTLVEVFATPGLSAGKSFVASEFKKIKTANSADGNVLALDGDYIAVFGSIPAAGTKVFFKTKSIGLANGIPGAESQTSCIVTA